MAMYADLYADQGSYFSTVINVATAASADFNLTNYTVRGTIRKSYSSTLSYSFVASITNAANGEITLSLDSLTTTAIKPGRYVYDVEVIANATGNVTRVVEGQIDFSAGASSNLYTPSIVTKTASYTLKITDSTVLCNASSAPMSITLPAASSVANKIFIIKKIDSTANAVTIVGTVDGTVNPTITTQYKTVTVQSNGVNWYDIS